MIEGSVLVDTNLLVLLTVGSFSRGLIARHKKTKAFSTRDYDLLVGLIGRRRVVILPHIAAETSNLLFFHDEPERRALLDAFARVLTSLDEQYVTSRAAANLREYRYLGLTDAAILATDGETELLTADAKLHIDALKRGLTSTNFNHLR